MYDHVLFSTDGSEAATDAIEEAFSVATNNDDPLHYVVDETTDRCTGSVSIR